MNKTKKVLLILGLLILVSVLTCAAVIHLTFGKLNRKPQWESLTDEQYEQLLIENIDSEEPAGPDTIDEEAICWGEKLDLSITGNCINVLLIGADKMVGTVSRSDSMILVSINLSTKKVNLISFLRDSYVQIPDHKENRLNAAYAFGGAPLLEETLKLNYGVPIDAYAMVDFDTFQKVIDVLGGVDVYLFKNECAIVNKACGTAYEEGYCHLTGKAALSYCRIRHLDSDFGRTERQRKVLMSIYNEFHTITFQEALDLIDEIFPLITTDITNTQIVDYAMKLLPILRECEINPVHIPDESAFSNATIRGMMVLIVDFDKARSTLESLMQE